MNDVHQLLAELYDQDITLSYAEGKLRIDGPKRALDPPLLARLKAQKLALIEILQQRTHAPAAGVPVSRGEQIPLSFAQSRLWFLDRLDPGNPYYNESLVLRIEGALDVHAMQQAWDRITTRHEILRSWFPLQEGQPVQVISATAPFPLQQHDLRDQPEPEALLEARLEGDLLFRFDLTAAPPIHAVLYRIADSAYVFVASLHHIITDGWSMGILIREFSHFYHHYAYGRPASLPELPFQYADFAIRQRARLCGAFLEHQLAWWCDHLAGAPTLLDLPTDRPRPVRQSHGGIGLPFRLTQDLVARLECMAQAQGATLFMALQAALAAVLQRYSGQNDLVIGFPIANRNEQGLECLIGFFVNALPLRIQLLQGDRFSSLLARIRQNSLEAFAHHDVPFERIVEALDLERDLGHTPLFQVVLALQNTPLVNLDLEGLRLSIPPKRIHTARFDLMLSLNQRSDGIHGEVEINTDIFEPATVERLLGHFRNALCAFAENPDHDPRRVELMGAEDKAQVLAACRGEARALPSKCFHEMVAEQARSRGDIPALHLEDGSHISYAQLQQRAELLAARLQQAGVGLGHAVAILTPDQALQFIAIQAVLLTGAFAVPLDAEAPEARVRFILDESRAKVLLSDRELAVPESTHPLPFRSNADETSSVFHPVQVPTISPIYVIYTSGSTGRPKGVQVSHAAIHNLVQAAARVTWRCSEPRLMTSSMPYTFDGAVTFWGGLAVGYELCLMPAECRPDPAAIARYTMQRGCKILGAPTATAPRAARHLHEAGYPLEALIFGGEAINEEDWQFLCQMQGTHGSNIYGPTETTVYATVSHPQPGVPAHIGQSLSGYHAYLVDPRLRLQPHGALGHLLLGGAGVATGYIGRPALTAARFLPDPYADEPGARVYASGDLAWLRADGNLGFRGRIDRQVKLRGFRIEPDEIAGTLARHELIQSAAVAVHGKGADGRLDAYFTSDGSPDPEALRAWLGNQLPPYMVPTTLTQLETIPLTPNGKVDHKALPEPEITATASEPPQGPIERRLAEIWHETLGVAEVGRHDEFFALGGHSLKAVRLVSAINAAFGCDLLISQIFAAPNIAGLAGLVQTGLEGRGGLPALLPREGKEPPALSYAQKRLWTLYKMAGSSPTYNVPFALRLDGPLDVAAFGAALDAVIARHDILRTTIADGVPEPSQRIASELLLDPPLLDLSSLPASVIDGVLPQLMRLASAQVFRLDGECVLRANLLRLAPDCHVLHFNVHHIAFDGTSVNVLVRETARLYRCHLGERIVLDPLPLQYADYALWQNGWLQGDLLQAQVAFWREALAGVPPLLNLPTDHPRPPFPSNRGARVAIHIPAPQARALESLASAHGATLFMVLMAAFKLLLAKTTQCNDIPVGTPVAGRNHPLLQGLIGFFVNTLVVRVPIDERLSLSAYLDAVRERVLAAFDHADLPFDKLVEELDPPRNLSHTPIYQAIFSWLDLVEEPGGFPGLALTPISAEDETAKWDLMLTLSPERGAIVGTLAYSVDLFEAATIEQMARRFERLLDQLPRLDTLREIQWQDTADREQLWQQLNPSLDEVAFSKPFHLLVTEQAMVRPEAIALSVPGVAELSYAGLLAAADALSARLRRVGVGVGDRVILYLDEQRDQLVAMLAVLQLGACFIPIDTGQQGERLAYTFADAQAKAGIAVDPPPVPSTDFAFVTFASEAIDEAIELPGVPMEAAMYLIYTSGSTGRPKGVQVSHAAFANTLGGLLELTDIAPETPITSTMNFSFDGCGLFWSFLAFGTRLVIAPRPLRLDPIGMARFAVEHHCRVLSAPTATATLIARHMAQLGAPPEILLFGGEAISKEHWHELAQLSQTRCYNCYGPTETTVFATAAIVRDATPHLGNALPGYRLTIQDQVGNPQAAGLPGQLVIGGQSLAMGYLGKPALTAARFLPDANGQEPGARQYISGDIVRLRADGKLDYQGRTDHQVKLRGFRIELGEIEAILREHEAVGDVRVLLVGDAENRQLVAAVCPETLELDALREYLAARLPDYMQPAQYLALAALPLNHNGKVDRAALSARFEGVASREVAYRAPRNPVEEALVEVWCEVLGRDRIGIDDHFFYSGGHSLKAAQVTTRIQERLQVALPASTLFEAPTVAALAQRIGNVVPTPSAENTSASRDVLSYSQTRLWGFYLKAGPSPAYNMTEGLRLHGPLDTVSFARALTALVTRHEVLRTWYARGEPHDYPVVQKPAPFPLLLIDARHQPEAGQTLLNAEALYPFKLDAEPLFRVFLVREAEHAHLMILNIHHSISDGWSQDILRSEIALLYEAALREPHRDPLDVLPPLPLQFREHARRERGYISEQQYRDHLQWWLDYLADLPESLSLPRDVEDPSIPSYAGNYCPIHIEADLQAAMDRLGKEMTASRFMILLAAVTGSLHLITGERDIPIGSPIAGRSRGDLEAIVGFFVDAVVTRTRPVGEMSFCQLLQQVRTEVLEAFDHQEVTLVKVIEEVNKQQHRDGAPWQVMVTLLNTPRATIDMGPMGVEPVAPTESTARYDLVYSLVEMDEQLAGFLQYRTADFSQQRAEQIVAHFKALLREGLARPNAPIQSLELPRLDHEQI